MVIFHSYVNSLPEGNPMKKLPGVLNTDLPGKRKTIGPLHDHVRLPEVLVRLMATRDCWDCWERPGFLTTNTQDLRIGKSK